jgi:hypothetical protein
MRPIISSVVHKARHSRTREDNHKQLQTTVVLLIVISWPRGLDLDLGLDSGLEQKQENASTAALTPRRRPRHLDLDTSTAEALRGRGLREIECNRCCSC